MIQYQYQLLRYLPDQVSGEFVNVGIVMFSPDASFVGARFIESIGRVSHFFHGIHPRHIFKSLQQIDKRIQSLQKELGTNRLFTDYKSVEQLTSSILPKDDSSLSFSDSLSGIGVDMSKVFERICHRMLFHYIEESERNVIKDDDEVWNKIYRKHFEEAGIKDQLTPHRVKTSNDQLEFGYAYKNEIWHCFEPHNFDLKRTESIKRKACTIAGRLMELQNTDEAIEVNILSLLPSNKPELKIYIEHKLNKTFGKSRIRIVTQFEAQELASKAKKEIDAHDAQK